MGNMSKSAGENLIYAIKNGEILKDYMPNTGREFHVGYEELYLHKFKKYQCSVSRYIRNAQLQEVTYNG